MQYNFMGVVDRVYTNPNLEGYPIYIPNQFIVIIIYYLSITFYHITILIQYNNYYVECFYYYNYINLLPSSIPLDTLLSLAYNLSNILLQVSYQVLYVLNFILVIILCYICNLSRSLA
jgi:hypothetical protein